jgi:signal transduction histidine kinase
MLEELSFAKQHLVAANRAKSEFLANMSHELRTPLNAIIGFSEIIGIETFGPIGSVKYRDYARDIHESGHHLLDLINDILDLSKVESGLDELCEEYTEVPKVIESVLKLVRQRAENADLELELDLSEDMPLLRADERKLKQILLNLLSNAIKFTNAGGTVTLKGWCRIESGYVFQVIDTGIGIALEDIPKALSQFGQVDSVLNRQHEGTGLGLPLTKSLVELHGGSLDLQSNVGVGTTVTVRFPAERVIHSQRETETLGTADRQAS